jgi:D-lactate dehydrogenase
MKVIAFDLFQKTFLSEVLDFEYVTMDQLLRESDVITLHAPYNKHTHHLINKGSFEKMKKGVILINTSRGALVDNEALVEALDQEIVGAAGLDVLEDEESLLGCKENETLQKLISRKNVYFTAHTAYYTKEAQERIWETTLDNIKHYLEGAPINNVT